MQRASVASTRVSGSSAGLQRYAPTARHACATPATPLHGRMTAMPQLPVRMVPVQVPGASRRLTLAVRAQAVSSPPRSAATKSAAPVTPKIIFEKKFDDARLEVQVQQLGDEYKVDISTFPGTPGRRVLHWAVDDWQKPDQAIWPAGTVSVDDKAVQTPVHEGARIQMTLPKDKCPGTLVFVLKELDPENWINGGGNFTVVLRQPDSSSIVRKVITAEATFSHWSLFQRLCMVNEVLDAATLAGPEGMALVFTWLRLSSTRVLTWYRNSNYQSKDIAHVQQSVAQNMAAKVRSAEDPLSRAYARMALAGLPRGGGNGDDIRMGILNIMRGNNIKEGHRPGIDEPFLEQWHQKLHQNTTQDDIYICEAYLAFLHSGNHDDYWRVLWERGNLRREDLENFSRPLKSWPMHLPQLIPAFQHYLWILKVTHSGADLDTAYQMTQGLMDDELRWIIGDILQNRNEWWVPGKIVDARYRLANYWKQPGASRDLLLLDIALEGWFRVLIERMDVRDQPNGGRDSLVDVIGLVLRNAGLGLEVEELNQCAGWWASLAGRTRWTPEWSLEALAAVQRTELSLAATMDTIYKQVQPLAEQFGEECKLDPKSIMNFGEEVVRGHPAFVLSSLLGQLEPRVREAAGVSSWQIVSQASAQGAVQCIPSLADVQGKAFDQPAVLIAEQVGGMEDIPANVTAVLTRSLLDVLSHVAIRARSQGVLLASCASADEWSELAKLNGRNAALSVNLEGTVVASDAPAAAAAGSGGSGSVGAGVGRLVLAAVEPARDGAWVLEESQFTDKKVGRKSQNLALLRSRLPAGLQVPTSLTLPFGTFERVLGTNPEVAQKLRAILAPLEASGAVNMAVASPALAQARQLVATGLSAPPQLVQEVASKAAAAGLIYSADRWTSPGSDDWEQAWSAICKVWASKWTERAWLSRKARGVKDDELYMAVLLQQVVPARYAFVLHTANPVTHDPSEAMGELVVGMGETLVGSHPGRALSFSAAASAGPKLNGFPSKRLALLAPTEGTLIARSDANGEDLDNFAGAGLYDSIPFLALEEHPVDYAADALLHDAGFRNDLLGQLTKAASDIKTAFGGRDQDIEGVYCDGKLYIVQARPQVMPN